MFSFSRFDRHKRLMTRMADALGTDLDQEMLSGRLSPEEYREKLFRCTTCEEADTCERILDFAHGFLEEAPEFCRNKADFDARV